MYIVHMHLQCIYMLDIYVHVHVCNVLVCVCACVLQVLDSSVVSVGGGEDAAVLADQLITMQRELTESRQEVVSVEQQRDGLQQQLDSLQDKLNVAEVRATLYMYEPDGVLHCTLYMHLYTVELLHSGHHRGRECWPL